MISGFLSANKETCLTRGRFSILIYFLIPSFPVTRLAFATVWLAFTASCPAGSVVGLRPNECYLPTAGVSWNDAQED